jgi:hypothetical protein
MANKVKITNAQGTQVFPITHVTAVIDSNGNSVEQVLGVQTDLIQQAQLEIGAVPSDLTPTPGSSHWVTSDGLYNLERRALPSEVIDLSSYTEITGGLGSGTNWFGGDYFDRLGKYVPVNAGDTYELSVSGHASNYAYMTTNSTPVANRQMPLVSGTSRMNIADGATIIVTPPSGTNYIYIQTNYNNGTPFTWTFKRLPSTLKDTETIIDLERKTTYGTVNLSQYPAIIAAIGDSEWMDITDRIGIFVPVQSGDCFKITQKNKTSNYAFLTTDVVTVGSTPSFADGRKRDLILLNCSCYECAPSDAKYLFLQTNYGGVDATPILERIGSAEYSLAVGKLRLGVQVFQDGIVVSKSEYKFAFSPSIGLTTNNGIYITYTGNENTTDGDAANHNNVMASTLWDNIDGMTKSELQPITTYQDSEGVSLGNNYKWRNGMHVKYGNSMGAFYCISATNATDYSFGYNHALEETMLTRCKLAYNDGTAKEVEFTGNNYRQMIVDMGYKDTYGANTTYNIDNQSIILYEGVYYIVLCTYVRSVNKKYPLVLLSSTDLATWTVQKMLGTGLHSASEIKFTINGGKIYLIYRNQTSATQGDGTQGYFLCCYNMSDGSAVYEIDNRSLIMSLPAAFTFNGKSYLGCMNRPYNLSTSVALTYPYYRQQFDFYEANENGVDYKFSLYNPNGLNYPVFLTIPANTSYATTPNDSLYMAFSEDRRNLNFRQIGNVTLVNITSLFL